MLMGTGRDDDAWRFETSEARVTCRLKAGTIIPVPGLLVSEGEVEDY
jgi:hypothetical protein